MPVEKTIPNPNNVKYIAYYLPQYHPVPENDRVWGKDFTDWTNVRDSVPLFEGHRQPRVPDGALGYYDLRDPQVLIEQATLAQRYGIHGFCYYFYWFDGRRILERPVETMLKSGRPDFPFCLMWANHPWTRRWAGAPGDVTIPQPYEKAASLIDDLLPYIEDPRYIRVDGRALITLYRPSEIPDLERVTERWRDVAAGHGIELYIAGALTLGFDNPLEVGLDGCVEFPPHRLKSPTVTDSIQWSGEATVNTVDYEATVVMDLVKPARPYPVFRAAMASWDNTPRFGVNGKLFADASPRAFELWLAGLVADATIRHASDRRIVFINSWNEWAEGTHIEPDTVFHHQWLEACLRSLGTASPAGESPTAEELADRFPGNPHVKFVVARHLFNKKQPASAWEMLEAGLAIDGRNRNLLGLKCRMLEAEDRTAEAIELARTLTELAGDAEHFHRLGNLLARAQRWADAAAAQRKACALDPRHPGALRGLALALRNTGDLDEALATAQGMAAIVPDDPAAHYRVANLLARLGRWDEAAAAYQRVLDRDSGHDRARRKRASARRKAARRSKGMDDSQVPTD